MKSTVITGGRRRRHHHAGRGLLTLALAVAVGLAVALAASAVAEAHFYPGCEGRVCKHHVIAPYEMGFLRTVGHCESRQGFRYRSRHGELRTGLRAVSPGGQYRGRYQFGMPDWRRAGGKGDPVRAGWMEQAYRAVVWLHRNGRQSWPNC